MISRRSCAIAAVLVIALVAIFFDRPTVITPKPGKPIPKPLALKPDEQEKIVVDTGRRTVSVVTPERVVQFSGVRHAEVVLKKDGKVEVQARTLGFCFEPGLGISYGDGPGATLDLQLGFWHSLGANLGVRVFPKPNGFVAVSYSLESIHLPNTSVFLGVGLGREILGGVRVRL